MEHTVQFQYLKYTNKNARLKLTGLLIAASGDYSILILVQETNKNLIVQAFVHNITQIKFVIIVSVKNIVLRLETLLEYKLLYFSTG